MADKDSIGGLNEAVETLNKDNHQDSIQSNQVLGDISATMQDVYSINSQMLEVMTAIQQSLAPDAFGAAQSTETAREEAGAGAPVVGGPADASTVTPAEGKKGMGMLGMLGVAAAGAAAGLVAAFAGFLDFDAEKVKEKVVTLASISDVVDMGDATKASLALGQLGAGLAIFGVGSAVAGLASAITNFTDPNWASSIVQNVTTLASISAIPFGNVTEAAGALGILGAGLAVFGAGSTIAGLASAITNFTDPNWASTIVQNVTTLSTISAIPFGNVTEASGALAIIAGGLAAFGVGSAIAGAGEAVARFAGGTDWTETTKQNVITLASIADEVSTEKAASFSEAMGSISAGLLKFSAGNFGAAFMEVGANILNFLSGNDSPIEQMMKIADNSYDLEVGAASLERIQSALSGLSDLSFDGSDLGLKEFAEDLVESIPAIEKAIMGGKIDGGLFFGDDVEFKGLASPDIDFESAIARMTQLRSALGAGSSMQGRPAQGQGADFDPGLSGGVVGATGAAVPVPPSTGSIINASASADDGIVETSLTLPYDKREKFKRAKELAKASGLKGNPTFEGNVPTMIGGQPIPTSFFTDDEISAINTAREASNLMSGGNAQMIPSRQSGENLQMAQSEANANDQGTGDGTVAVQNNISPNTVNNASTTNLASRNEHHTEQKYKLMGFA